MSEAINTLSLDEFLALEQTGDVRHELVGGRAYGMSGGTERHDVTVNALLDRIRPGARAAGCRTFTGNRLLLTTEDNGYYPDLMVVCGPAAHVQYEREPALVVEVLSSSTATKDRREKATAYARIPSVSMLVLVDPDQRRIEVARTLEGRVAGWEALGPGQVLATPWGAVSVDELYDDVDVEAST